MIDRFRDRTEAGRLLAERLTEYTNAPDTLVLALPRGGVPVAYEIARALHLPLDICLTRKLGVPGRKELAMGAIGQGGIRVINESIVEDLGLSERAIERVAREEAIELERRDRLYRGDRPLPAIEGKTILLVDDGIATGATLKAAILTLQARDPRSIVVAVPVAPAETRYQLEELVDRVVCVLEPEALMAISAWYDDFSQTSDGEVRELLAGANRSGASD
ncbi:phosphoribosyltransferase [Pannus brasiliensis CCIBt3594]|uniref:Phosphoribosyltransferase n=1 Tax=Pannus brasiliensis CCIBt3594 TaxID=1427578 RepID=A0AAW9QKY1_9CHRO